LFTEGLKEFLVYQQGRTIIFAEDNLSISKLVRFRLQKEGFNIISLPTGEGVVEAVIKNQPQLVILDIMMPVKDGMTILKEIKANTLTSRIPVVMLTSQVDEGVIVEAFKLGAADYITKPFSSTELTLRINKQLNLVLV
jgi:two-component system alkaline phosphatase synthesis response regulator PhoP